MKHLLFTDFHLTFERLKEQKEVLFSIIEFCNNKKIKSIIFLGDMFNNRKNVTPQELIVFKSFVNKCQKNNIRIDAIAGNHDKPTNESQKSYLGVFENETKNVFVYENKDLKVWNKFLFIPYFSDKILIELIENFPYKKDIEYIFMHTCFNGSKANSGKIMKSVVTIELFKDYKKLKKIFVGHYHEYNELYGGKVVYIGNVMKLNFGERLQKGFYVFDSEKDETKFFPSNSPDFVTYKLNCDIESYKRAFNIVRDENNKNNYIRLFFLDKKEKLSSIPEQELHKKSKCKLLKIEKDFIDNEFEKQVISIDLGKDMISNFLNYSKEEKMNNEEKKVGIKIIRQVLGETIK